MIRIGAAMMFAMALLGLDATTAADTMKSTPLTYPAVTPSSQVDVYHGVRVADPYRSLESLADPVTKRWVDAQNALSQPILEGIPVRAKIKQRLTELWNFERYEVPVKRGGHYFYLRNDGLQDQSVLYVADSADGKARVLLDPNQMSKDATVALGEFVPSPDGKLLAYSLSDGGTDWRSWHVRDVTTGKDLADVLRFIKFRDVSWTADSKALYYSRYPQRPDGNGDDLKQMSVYFHRLGATAADSQVFAITDHPTRYPFPQVTDDGRYVVLGVYDGSQSTGIYYQPLDAQGMATGAVVRLLNAFDGDYHFVASLGDTFYVHTNAGSPNGRLMAADVSKQPVVWRDVVVEKDIAMIDVAIVGKRVVAQYLKDARSLVSISELDGRAAYDVALPGLGQAIGFAGEVDDPETFFAYTDFLTPMAISTLNVATGAVKQFRAPKFAANIKPYVTEQVFYQSKDGTRVPMFITRKRDFIKDGSAPTLLYGYGGFNIPQQPGFSVPVLVWLEMGGVYAQANLRGGSEYGEAWHEAGTKLHKQNVFDDFIAAAEYLVKEKYTSTPKLAIRGRSNGGLLVGAALTQRPDLFGATLPAVGVLDMLRYHTASANARQWSTDYGLSENAEDFKAQYAYSPLHNVKTGICYPPTLITTADRDDRVVPWHSYKFAATLQQAQAKNPGCHSPVLLRVETRAGHGAGKPVWMQIEDFADQWAFVSQALKME